MQSEAAVYVCIVHTQHGLLTEDGGNCASLIVPASIHLISTSLCDKHLAVIWLQSSVTGFMGCCW